MLFLTDSSTEYKLYIKLFLIIVDTEYELNNRFFLSKTEICLLVSATLNQKFCCTLYSIILFLFIRYYTSELRDLLNELAESEKKKELALKDTTSSLFRHFGSHHETFQRVLSCLSTLDVLLSFTAYSQSYSDMCRPTIIQVENDQQPFINIRDGKHPCMLEKATNTFIPNDIILADQVN